MANEKRLIDANALYEKLEQRYQWSTGWAHKAFGTALDDVVDAPTVDAVEVVHGRWKYYHKQNKAVCANCSFERDLDANFGGAVSCPNCGAKMDGGGDNG